MEKRVAICTRAVVLTAAMAAVALPLLFGASAAAENGTAPSSNDCTRNCGDIIIPYPFGVEPGCYLEAGFNLTCDRSRRPPKLFLGDGTVQVLDISTPNSTVRVGSSVVEFPGGAAGDFATWGGALGAGGPYSLSSGNKLLVVGCDVMIVVEEDGAGIVSTCAAFCNQTQTAAGRLVVSNSTTVDCSGGVGCCQARILSGRSSHRLQRLPINGSPRASSSARAYIVDSKIDDDSPDTFSAVLGNTTPGTLHAVLDWWVNSATCGEDNRSPLCPSNHSFCSNSSLDGLGHYCTCLSGYEGNPYVLDGCQDVNECESLEKYQCYGTCKNTEGSYECNCSGGYKGNASIPNGCIDIDECAHPDLYPCFGICSNLAGTFSCQCPNGTYGDPKIKRGCTTKKYDQGLSIGLGAGGATTITILALLGGPFIKRKVKERKLKTKFFKQNHGLLLQQMISRNANISERMIITLRDLEKATDHFDRACVVGGGGHGVVFKGTLGPHVVAIKKSKIVVQKEIDEFINEVVILSQVNHRNIVKLLGCCLETEVPLLVYEFITNGTLYHHLHVEGPISVSWNDRMRIALEVARALSYMHSAASMPIFHRDIKSSNILLDDSLSAKVSDFGASRYIPIDETGVTTAIQGTIGYLDPMYYTTGRLTDKSDVFSFGVVLIELLTRKKPTVYQYGDNGGLVSHFSSILKEGSLVDIMDPQVMEEEDGEAQEVATLAAMCTEWKGEDRPTMREVEMALESLLVKKKQIPCKETLRRCGEDETIVHFMSIEGVTEDASRQYTMEQEILLSARYPR